MDSTVLSIVPLMAAYLLDLLLGDPRWLPHPVRLFGNCITHSERVLNKNKHRFTKGLLLTLVICTITYLFFRISESLLYQTSNWLGVFYSSIFIFYGLANKSLLHEGTIVFNELKNEGLEAGRKRLSWIVGRDTNNLDANQIRIAVFETLSENLSDGVIAPLFYYALGGMPAMMTYKMINTLDSMIGYKNERYFYFGKSAARLDDIVNYIPARITALLISLTSWSKSSLQFIFKYGKEHSSPNSGYPEAALAGALNCRFGGTNRYNGKPVEKPYIGYNERTILHEELSKVKFINHSVTLLFIVIIVAVKLIFKLP